MAWNFHVFLEIVITAIIVYSVNYVFSRIYRRICFDIPTPIEIRIARMIYSKRIGAVKRFPVIAVGSLIGPSLQNGLLLVNIHHRLLRNVVHLGRNRLPLFYRNGTAKNTALSVAFSTRRHHSLGKDMVVVGKCNALSE